jgi:phospholipase B1
LFLLIIGTGAAASSIFGIINEFRGYSFSAGGDQTLETIISIPNILKKYNKNLVGYSTGKDVILSPFGRSNNHFNIAASGHEAKNIPEQARELVRRMKNSKEFNYKTDWKLVTIFIGGNDLCKFCKNKTLHSPQSYINFIQEGLDILFRELSKTFVNLISVMKIHTMPGLNLKFSCGQVQNYVCSCASNPENEKEKKFLIEANEQYVNYTYNLVNSNRYERNDFTVVVQPLLESMDLPRTSNGDVDLTYYAPDCMHYSKKGHAKLAVSLWNNMLTAVGKKNKEWIENEKILCPTAEKPYLCTRKNKC